MKKTIFRIPYVEYLVVAAVCLVGILVGSFLDLQISEAIVDLNDPVGKFVETIGQAIGYVTLPFGAVLVFKGLRKYEKTWTKVLGTVVLVLTLAISIYILAGSMDANKHQYGFLYSTLVSYLIAIALIGLETFLAFFFLKDGERKEMLVLGAIFILSNTLQFLILRLLKNIDCRPRYRFLINPEDNTAGEVFRNWWEFKPFSASGDDHYSWPSGHSATIVQLFLLPAITPFLRYKHPGNKLALILVAGFLSLFVMFYRIRVGAHFLSDVSFGALIGIGIELGLLALGTLFFREKKEKPEKENKAA